VTDRPERYGKEAVLLGGPSAEHANFIVNTGSARAADIEAVIAHIEATVREKTGIRLVREVRIVGEAAGDARPGERK